jgi:hypothetical protein
MEDFRITLIEGSEPSSPLSLDKQGEREVPQPPAFLRKDDGEFTLNPLNLMRPSARRLLFLFNLILTPLDPASSDGWTSLPSQPLTFTSCPFPP